MSLIRWISSHPAPPTSGLIPPPPPLLMTVPHSGETVPQEAFWLNGTPEETLLTDVDRFVDELYLPAVSALGIPLLKTEIHRYAADLNRYPSDIDSGTVEGAQEPSGQFKKGFIWSETTQGTRLLFKPIPQAVHQLLVTRYHDPFHALFQQAVRDLQQKLPKRTIFHLDCHSMPSQGTQAHSDAGQRRPDIVVSDWNGKSASPAFRDLVFGAFQDQGFQVSLNHPYLGGRITQRYGRPELRHETIQIELNRALYMQEFGPRTKKVLTPSFSDLQLRLQLALEKIVRGLPL